ncbi:MAG: hypothetical protein K0R67_4036 [Paenibacillus sp.]|nr:hypothetical protein [Paenibacillus sp.]
MACGGNGTIYSMIAAHLLRSQILGQAHPMAELLSPDRNKSQQFSLLGSTL